MRYLDRSNVDAPECLSLFKAGRDDWGKDVKSNHRAEIWVQLNLLQGRFCAYCGQELQDENVDNTIEHFYPRNKCGGKYRDKTFDWCNLYGSCKGNKHCDKFKDLECRDYEKLLKPSRDDATKFFKYSTDGQILVKNNLGVTDDARGQYTIDVFNLNIGILKSRRKIAWKTIEAEVLGIYEVVDDDELFTDSLNELLKIISELEFSASLDYLANNP